MSKISNKSILLLIQFLVFSNLTFSQSGISETELNKQAQNTFNQLCTKFKPLSGLPTNDLIIKIGLEFLGKSYVANTLESNTEEKLVVNLSEFDCTTFAENCLALARTIKSPACTFDIFKMELLKIRYRKGKLEDYTSRLHYFSDWIYENEQKQIVKNISCEMGNFPFNNFVNYMSQHSNEYAMLNNNTKLLGKIKTIENVISVRKSCYIPKTEVVNFQSKIQDGDILGITTNIQGMDMAHVVLAFHKNGQLYIIHASSKLHKVVISTETLVDYLAHRADATGIMVARPL